MAPDGVPHPVGEGRHRPENEITRRPVRRPGVRMGRGRRPRPGEAGGEHPSVTLGEAGEGGHDRPLLVAGMELQLVSEELEFVGELGCVRTESLHLVEASLGLRLLSDARLRLGVELVGLLPNDREDDLLLGHLVGDEEGDELAEELGATLPLGRADLVDEAGNRLVVALDLPDDVGWPVGAQHAAHLCELPSSARGDASRASSARKSSHISPVVMCLFSAGGYPASVLRRAETVAQWTASPDLATPGEARRFLRDCFREASWSGDAELALLAASELAGNAWRHGDGIRAVRMCASDGFLRIEVDDCAPDKLPVPPSAETPARRGLAIVTNVSDRWGVEVFEDFKRTWFEISSGWGVA